MENMTAQQAEKKWREYQDYKVECMKAHGEFLDFDTWMVLHPGFTAASPPNASAIRKATPIFSGVLKYFPDAIAAVARHSKNNNDKHNPGEPLHWSRDKSSDHADCLTRHQMEFDQVDPDPVNVTGEYHAAAVAWRALAQLQLLEEKRKGK